MVADAREGPRSQYPLEEGHSHLERPDFPTRRHHTLCTWLGGMPCVIPGVACLLLSKYEASFKDLKD